MKDLMQKAKSFIIFDFPLQSTYIDAKFAETHQKLQLEVPEWSTTATRQQLISNYWFTYVVGHFSLLFGLPALVFFFLSGGFQDIKGYLVSTLLAGLFSYVVLYLFHYHPAFYANFLPRLETTKEIYDRKQHNHIEKCRQTQLSNFALTLVFYVFEKSCGLNTLLCNDQSANLLMKLYGVDPGSLKKNLEFIYGKKKTLLPRKQTEMANRFDEAISYFEEMGFEKGVDILMELQQKLSYTEIKRN
ncbi:MAG: hypothetical protein EPO58_17610 [Chitinophagaceae bacterium]|nr:MAG: hypothetical protein EPO58_17610 [Chitinophagaceae bacterium]